ncbi:DUF1538 domain-containing protein [Thermoactinomyces sp. AMNI-1]|uniref:DUF1538 domain-containing protein n=1 Tax=Thermoactinomyces mirandus TaxID=2756294 RepID=A0A7W1XQT2_9BACL|nr:DUF1538 domain-containing protein [Thermoactinomyces mirandus]
MDHLKNTGREVIIAILPMTAVIFVLQFTVIWLPAEMFLQFLIGVVMVGLGLFLFLIGVDIGMIPVGEMIGSALSRLGKAGLVILFSVILGIASTVAEPDVIVLASQVDMVTGGAIPKSVLIFTVALGVGIFVGLAILRILLNIPITYLLIGGYSLILILSFFTPTEFVPVALDSGGVTTGPMTVPFIMALGLGVASVLSGKSASSDGFGLVALASVGPVIAVLLLGVMYS